MSHIVPFYIFMRWRPINDKKISANHGDETSRVTRVQRTIGCDFRAGAFCTKANLIGLCWVLTPRPSSNRLRAHCDLRIYM